ncbi:hypothetical protein M422DRAFT_270012 [Sphaerobolus stellatus SS14]|uniref:Uncharacterized protein n=1 Tax=Sphaerobolus stellatus (strain SS14) TaxID=990650 RepID=A0A0C9UU28_SPHS4|nr:hypothetical protein M422DRAFT_270012 [Sphaerobolus stellatus SS14]
MSQIKRNIITIDPNFDDYNTGPTIQEHRGVPLHIKNTPIFFRTQLEPLGIWSLWQDYGYRIDNNFAQTLTSETPYLVEEHYLPIAEVPGQEHILQSLKEWDLSRKRDPKITISDICFLGMEEMLALADGKTPNTDFDLFVRGICYNPEDYGKEELIHLDITHDAKPIGEIPIYLSLDIDSLIWNTHRLWLLGSLEIHMVPYMQRKPPIEVHNHTYVKILKPQTDIQQANNEYTTYEQFKTQSIPHIHFGYSGHINVWIAFPRMIHRQHDSPYWATQIPFHVQDRWFTFIVQPSIRKIYGRGSKEYVSHSSKEYMAKARGRTETRFVDHKKLLELQDEIHQHIQEDCNENLDIFGSFFFILEARGIKLWTKDREHLSDDIFDVMRQVMPTLDLEYMSHAESGECVLDLGISASPEASEPMVGLWNLTHVDASFAKAGTNTPRLFNIETLSDYGGLSAEFPNDRAAITHMRYRMAYDLVFEIVRGHLKFPENSDAYLANGSYHARIKQLIDHYKYAKTSSYRVRDELRASIKAVKSLVLIAKEKMEMFLDFGTVIWISSKTYFEFWIRRIEQLKYLQMQIAQQRPRNACNLSLLVMHLIKTVFTTPQPLDSHTHFILHDLNFHPSSQRFGIFFIPELHWETLAVDLMEDDNDAVLQFVTNQPGKRKERQKDPLEDSRHTSEYPLGTHPSWDEIIEILDSNPTLITHSHMSTPFWEDHQSEMDIMAIQLMAKWTRQYTFSMNEIFLKDEINYPVLNNWDDIMQFWSIQGIPKLVHVPSFNAHKAYWKGLPPGPQQLAFADCFHSFFPPLTVKFQEGSYWISYLTNGYIKDYHEILKSYTEQVVLNFQDSLKAAFDLLECLPDRAPDPRSQAWKYNDNKGGPCFTVNARTYKIRGIGPKKARNPETRPKAVATHMHIHSLLLADSQQITVPEAVKYIKGQQRNTKKQAKWSTRMKNYREPPPRQKKVLIIEQDATVPHRTPESNLSISEEVEETNDTEIEADDEYDMGNDNFNLELSNSDDSISD